jgi:predicted ATPase
MAIEIAAGLTDGRSPKQIAEDLVKFGVTKLEGSRKLQRAFDLSYKLLKPEEQTLFTRLGVFAGGCTEEAITDIYQAAGDPPSGIPRRLTALVRKKLLILEDLPGREPRYRMLQTTQDYALERLNEATESVRI